MCQFDVNWTTMPTLQIIKYLELSPSQDYESSLQSENNIWKLKFLNYEIKFKGKGFRTFK